METITAKDKAAALARLQGFITDSVAEAVDYGGAADYVAAFFDLIHLRAAHEIEMLKEGATPDKARQLDELNNEIFNLTVYGKAAAKQAEAYTDLRDYREYLNATEEQE